MGTVGPQKLATMFPVLLEDWVARTPEYEKGLEEAARAAMARHGEVVSDLTREVRNEAVIDGLRLHGQYTDEETGEVIELPEMTMIRYTAMAIPHKEVDDGDV